MAINQNILFIALTILAGISILLFFWNIFQQFSLRKIKKKQAILFGGKDAKDLEKIILTQQQALAKLDKQSEQLFGITAKLTASSQIGLSKVGMVRFNPFKNLGGNQSFSIAFLNHHLNGLVITSIYNEGGSRFYSKTILNGKSQKEFPLTEEEKHAIQIAISN